MSIHHKPNLLIHIRRRLSLSVEAPDVPKHDIKSVYGLVIICRIEFFPSFCLNKWQRKDSGAELEQGVFYCGDQ